MNEHFVPDGISARDSAVSAANIEFPSRYISGSDRSLVFFVGAGASIAGHTGMPSSPSLLFQLLFQMLSHSAMFDSELSDLSIILKDICWRIGFEITLNDFWQICGKATSQLFQAFGELETNCVPNRVHTFIAYWLSTGGTVITTNYDRLIEQQWSKTDSQIQSRYKATGSNSFTGWMQELNEGHTYSKSTVHWMNQRVVWVHWNMLVHDWQVFGRTSSREWSRLGRFALSAAAEWTQTFRRSYMMNLPTETVHLPSFGCTMKDRHPSG